MGTEAVPAIDIEDLKFGWKRQELLLDVPAFRLARGERAMLFGQSGSGKSTLLGLITGVLGGASGSIRILGEDILALAPARRDALRADHIGYIFQSFNLVPYLSVTENITLPLKLSRKRAAAVDGSPAKAAAVLLERLGLGEEGIAGRKVTELSIGQQQRVAAARALIGKPDIIFADEPTSSLDEDAKRNFLALLLEQAEEAGAAVLFVSHDHTLKDQFGTVLSLEELNRAAKGKAA